MPRYVARLLAALASPLLRRLLGHLPSLCRLSSRWSCLFHIFFSSSKISCISESCVASGAESTVGVGIIGLPFRFKRPMVSLTLCISARTTSISGTAGQSSSQLRQGANWIYGVILPTTPRVREWKRHCSKSHGLR